MRVVSVAFAGALLAMTACAKGQGDGIGIGGSPDGSVVNFPDAGIVFPDANNNNPTPDAGGGGTPQTKTMSQTTDRTTITSANSVACADNTSGNTTDNSYYRVFDLSANGVNSTYSVSSVHIGVEQASSTAGSQQVDVRLYTLSGAVSVANLTQIGTASASVSDATGSFVDVPITASVPGGSQLVVEVHTADGTTAGNTFYIGSNAGGESAPGYIMAADCSVTDMTTDTAIGYPDMHMLVEVTGTYTP